MTDLLGPTATLSGVTVRPGENRTFSDTDTWFKDCSDPSIDDGTEFGAAWFNAVLANLRGVMRGNGQTGAGADVLAQDNGSDVLLLNAIRHLMQRGQAQYCEDQGTPGHIVAALSPVPAEWKKGMEVRVKMGNNPNPGAVDIALNTLPVKAVVNPDGSALTGGELANGAMITLRYDGTACQLISRVSAAAVTPGFRNFVAYNANGSFTVPAGVTKIYYEVWGGGGGGGSSTTAGFGAPGGAGGGHVRGTATVTPGAVLPITIGAGGASGNGTNPGGNGGASSVGALATANGGTGGNAVGSGTSNTSSASGAPGGTAVGQPGNLIFSGQNSFPTSSGGALNGSPGGNSFGFAGGSSLANSVAYGIGTGGSGASGGNTNPTNAGAPGLVMIWY